MRLSAVHTLNSARIAGIHSLVSDCRQAEGLSLSFPYTDADLYVLLQENGQILSAAAFTDMGDVFECSAFTHPSARRRGCFSRLLKAAVPRLPEGTELLFYTSAACRDAQKTLAALGARKAPDEYFMELFLDNFQSKPSPDFSPNLPWHKPFHPELKEEASILTYQAFCGSVHIAVYPDWYYLFGLEIQESFRGLGLGQALLFFVLSDLKDKNPLPLRLQVSGDNLPALSLYEKTGFRITETLSCHLYQPSVLIKLQ